LVIARQDAGRARRSALAAWCVVATLGTGVCAAVGWTTSKMADTRNQVQNLTDKYDAIQAVNKKLEGEIATARQDAQTARLSGAEASGRLAAYVEQAQQQAQIAQAKATTRPTSIIQRIASALAEQ